MTDVLKEKKLLYFYRQNSKSIEHDLMALLQHYNKIGEEYPKDSSMQLGLLSIFILQLIKSSNAPVPEIRKVLKTIDSKL